MRKADYEWDFLQILHPALKTEIVGKVYTDVVDDKLQISVTYDRDVWSYELDDFGTRLYNGLSVEWVVNEVKRLYRRHVLKKHFYSERGSSI